MTDLPPGAISFGRRVAMLAAEHPDRPAVIFVPAEGETSELTWRELDRRSNQAARLLAGRGVDERSLVAIGLPNSLENVTVTLGVWKLGACALPLNPALPARERDQILELAAPRAVAAEWEGTAAPRITPADLAAAAALPDAPLPDRIAHPGKAIGSGGSTGRSKIIVDPSPWARVPGAAVRPGGFGDLCGMRAGQIQLVPGALYSNTYFGQAYLGLFEAHTLVVMARFDAARTVDLIERYRAEYLVLVPTMMRRIARLPGIEARDLSSLEAVLHTAAPCPPWVKESWIDLIGGERLIEGYGATEGLGNTIIRGDEWLAHRGSVGRPTTYTELRILDESGRELPPGEVGEVFMRRCDGRTSTYRYVGSPPAKTTPDGFASVGDLGRVDEAGYLYLADRRVDMIVSGGYNVYPAEVEAALSEHPAVSDVAVIGLPDDEWGRRVHALIVPADPAAPPTPEALNQHCRERLAAYKAPKSYDFVASLPRDGAGKLRRSALAPGLGVGG